SRILRFQISGKCTFSCLPSLHTIFNLFHELFCFFSSVFTIPFFLFFFQLLPSLSVKKNPFIQSKGLIVRKLAEAVDHLAGNAVFLSGLEICPSDVPCLLLKHIYQTFIHTVVDMSVEHVCPGIPTFIPSVLAVITEDGIMAQDHFSPVVLHLRV